MLKIWIVCFVIVNFKKIDVSKFKTSKVKSMENMFYNCLSLKNLDVSKFDIRYVVDMRNMFEKCRNISYLDLVI